MKCSLAPALLFLSLGCATVPGVSTQDLPLKRVVIYRNGVAYFEREGKTSAQQLRFQVRPDHVGDFLATLAVMESGGASVRAASFPLGLEDKEPQEGGPSTRRLSTVTLELDGKEHALTVGYVAEQPVWKPSYRLVFEQGEPVLQAWGILQNVSGEDWRNVSLSLVAGAPIAFRSTLGTPVTPGRPVVSDSGEVITAVPRSETTLATDETAPSAQPAPPAADRDPGSLRGAPAPAPGPSEPTPAPQAPRQGTMRPRDLALLATRTVQAGATRYDVPHAVTVPNDSATMVLLLAQKVPGEAAFMYAPEGGVPDSHRHPFRVARFKNATGGLLEKGPLAVFEQGAFLGQGVLEPLSAQGEATVPFALEREVAVDVDRRSETLEARLAKIEHGQLTIERDQVLRTRYRLRNGGDRDARLLVRHPRQGGTRLHAPPGGTDDQVGKGSALVPTSVPRRGATVLEVDERRAFSTGADWFSNEADAAVRAYMADGRASPKVVAALKSAWDVREDLLEGRVEAQKLQSEKAVLERAASDTRENLRAISRNRTGVESLRKRLSERLLALDKRLAELTQEVVALALSLEEQRVRFDELVRDIQLSEPLQPGPAGNAR